MKYLADQNRTCFQYESGTYSLLSGTRQWIGLVQSHDVDPNMNVIEIRYQGSTDRNVDDVIRLQVGSNNAAIDVEMHGPSGPVAINQTLASISVNRVGD